ncbi:MAG: TonB-dependent receptor, partial [Bacteroidales bacterium]|nr:TonB-dependent receptor [Bacteroidales bacterium]
FGFNNTFEYKNFDLTIYINGTYGNKIFNELKRINEDPMSRSGMLSTVKDYARIGLIDPNGDPDDAYNQYVINPETTVPRIATSDPNENGRISDRYVEDGSYIRIKSFVLGYTFPRKWTNAVKINRIRIYVNIQNLYTFTKYTGYDPEIGAQRQNVLKSGVDQGRYPSPRVYQFGVNLNF